MNAPRQPPNLSHEDCVEASAPLRVALSGASGLIGGLLRPYLAARGHRVNVLVRGRAVRSDANEIAWDPTVGRVDAASLEGIDAAVHLSGENIAVRWSTERKQRFFDSRVRSTEVICRSLVGLKRPPRVLVAASAIGFYGDRGDEVLTEDSPPGAGYLPELCQQWEAATGPAREAGIRVVNLRIGVVLSARGGALAQMLTPFKLGLGGPLGSGRQFLSWIAADDLIGAIYECLTNKRLAGPLNATAPEPVTQRDFARALGRVLHRPTFMPMPAFAVKLAFGEMGDSLLLGSTRAVPAKLNAAGFSFSHPTLEQALRAEMSCKGRMESPQMDTDEHR